MDYIMLKTDAHAFLCLEQEAFEKYIKSMQYNLVSRMFDQKANDFNLHYYFRFERIEWDDNRIFEEIQAFKKHEVSAFQYAWEKSPEVYDYFEINGQKCSIEKAMKILVDKHPFDIKLCFEDKWVAPEIQQYEFFKIRVKQEEIK